MPHDDFEEQDYNIFTSVGLTDTEIIQSVRGGGVCSLDGCTLGEHPAEDAWIELMTAIPKKQSATMDIMAKLSNCPMPSPEIMEAIISGLRPSGEVAEKYSIEFVRETWEREVFNPIRKTAADLDVMLKDLAPEWVGEDFDMLSEQVTQNIRALNVTADHIELLNVELYDQETTLYHTQGGDSGQIPFPAPQFFDADKGKDDVSVHVRPAYTQGDCQVKTNEEALELTGADPDAPNDFHQREEERIEEIIEERLEAMTPEEREAQNLGELENEAQQQARDEIQPDIDAYKQEVHNGQLGESERISEEVIDNRNQADSSLSQAKFTSELAEIEYQDFTEQANGPSYGGLTSPGPITPPDTSGMTEPGGYSPGT